MPSTVLRARPEDAGAGSPRVTNMELFFDLVYVFAITQISDFLFDHLSARGALETLLLFGAVWWAWNYTAWATNWVDPDRPRTAVMMLVMMALGLVMAAALPDAFGSRGLPFAIAYVALQLVRTGFVVCAFPREDAMRTNNVRLLSWLAIAGALWIAGATVHGDARFVVWIVAAILDLAAPLHGFWLPRLGTTPIESWRLTGTHLAERYQLVLIIALGESLLRVGATFAEQHGSFAVDAAFVAGFVISAALWATYFMRIAELGATLIASRDDAARTGRSGYAYAHAVMVAGVIVVAVAIRLTIEDPHRASSFADAAAVLGGPALYLAGLTLFERAVGLAAVSGRPIATIAALAVLAAVAALGADRLALMACATVVVLGFVAFIAVNPFHDRVDPDSLV